MAFNLPQRRFVNDMLHVHNMITAAILQHRSCDNSGEKENLVGIGHRNPQGGPACDLDGRVPQHLLQLLLGERMGVVEDLLDDLVEHLGLRERRRGVGAPGFPQIRTSFPRTPPPHK